MCAINEAINELSTANRSIIVDIIPAAFCHTQKSRDSNETHSAHTGRMGEEKKRVLITSSHDSDTGCWTGMMKCSFFLNSIGKLESQIHASDDDQFNMKVNIFIQVPSSAWVHRMSNVYEHERARKRCLTFVIKASIVVVYTTLLWHSQISYVSSVLLYNSSFAITSILLPFFLRVLNETSRFFFAAAATVLVAMQTIYKQEFLHSKFDIMNET